jgi:dihydroorotase
VADVAVLKLVEGDFGFLDIRNLKMSGTEKIVAELTIREGNIVWDLNGLAADAEFDEDLMPHSSVSGY